jgi:hypothetical protein
VSEAGQRHGEHYAALLVGHFDGAASLKVH